MYVHSCATMGDVSKNKKGGREGGREWEGRDGEKEGGGGWSM